MDTARYLSSDVTTEASSFNLTSDGDDDNTNVSKATAAITSSSGIFGQDLIKTRTKEEGTQMYNYCTTIACRSKFYMDSKHPIPEDMIHIFRNFRSQIYSLKSQMKSHTIVKKINNCIHLAKIMRHHTYVAYFLYANIAFIYDMNDSDQMSDAIFGIASMKEYVDSNSITDPLIVSVLSHLHFIENMFYYSLKPIKFEAAGKLLQENWILLKSLETGVERSLLYLTVGNDLQRMLIRDYDDKKDLQALSEVVEMLKVCYLFLQDIGIETFPLWSSWQAVHGKDSISVEKLLHVKEENLDRIDVTKNLRFLRLTCYKCYSKCREIVREDKHVYSVTKAYFDHPEEKTFPLIKMIRILLDVPESNAGRNRKYTGDLLVVRELMKQAIFELENLPSKSLKLEMNVALAKAGLKFREYQRLVAIPYPGEGDWSMYYKPLLQKVSEAEQYLEAAVNLAKQSPTFERDLVHNFSDEIKKIKINIDLNYKNKRLQSSQIYRKMLEQRKMGQSQIQPATDAAFTTDSESQFKGFGNTEISEGARDSDSELDVD